MDQYYDKYWERSIDGGVLNLPPSWTVENLRWHLSFFGRYLGENVLDVGAGEGSFLNYVTNKNPQIKSAVASELSQEAISLGQKKYPAIIFRQDNLENLSFDNESFDTVFAVEVVEHLLDIDACLDQVSRVLKKGGYFCVTTTEFNLLKKVVIAMFYWDRFFYPNNPHIRFFTKKALSDLCKKRGLILVDYKWNRSYFGLMPKGQMAVFRKK